MAPHYVQAFLDHANLSTTSRYLNITAQGMHAALRRVEAVRALVDESGTTMLERQTIVGRLSRPARGGEQMSVDESTFAQWRQLAADLGLKEDYFLELFLDDSDWTVVIKASAVIETAINHAFAIFVPPPIASYLELAPLWKKRELSIQMKLLDKGGGTQLGELARIRNMVVHKAEGFRFTFAEHLKSQDEVESFLQGFERVWTEEPDGAPNRKAALESPRGTVILAALKITQRLTASAKVLESQTYHRTDSLQSVASADPTTNQANLVTVL